MTLVKPAHASGTIPPQGNYCVYSTLGPSMTCGFPTADAACGGIALPNGGCQGAYAGWIGGTSCPANSTGTTSCTCNDGYQPDSAGTSCVADTCPVQALTAPPFNDACAEVLEDINSTQAQKDAACGALTDKLKTGMACFENKLANMSPSIPLNVTSDIRDTAYQAHLRDIWDKMETLVKLMKKDPTMQTTCAVRRAEVAAEKGCDNAGPCKSCYSPSSTQRSHCIAGMPASPNPNDAQHTQGRAFDVNRTYTINPLQAALSTRRPPETIQQFLDEPPNCSLIWGGTFTTNMDPVHFYTP